MGTRLFSLCPRLSIHWAPETRGVFYSGNPLLSKPEYSDHSFRKKSYLEAALPVDFGHHVILTRLCGFRAFRRHRARGQQSSRPSWLTWLPPCSVWMYRGIGNRACRISCASSRGACRRCLKFSYSGMSW